MMFASNIELVEHLLATRVLKTLSIIKAFKAVDRVNFAPPLLKAEAYGDYPLPIGLGQTISQPTTVAFMLELLQPQTKEKVLEVGAGSGYVAALLAAIVGEKGLVVALERHQELVAQALANLKNFKFPQLKLLAADGSQGYLDQAPYQRILVSAAALEVPASLKSQLALGGRLVVPVGAGAQALVVVERQESGFNEQRYPGFVFVPLVKG